MAKYAAFVFLLLLLFSCDETEVFNQYQSIENQLWSKQNAIEFNVENTDTISKKNVFINLRNTNDYPFKTIFLIGKIKFPSGETLIDTLEYEMADQYGNFLGSGISSIKENKLFFKKDVLFNEQGTYRFSVRHVTRSIDDIDGTKPLKGIEAVGLNIMKE